MAIDVRDLATPPRLEPISAEELDIIDDTSPTISTARRRATFSCPFPA